MGLLEIEFPGFAWHRLKEEAQRNGVPVEDLVRHAVTYYLADLDSGRMAARPFRAAVETPPMHQAEG